MYVIVNKSKLRGKYFGVTNTLPDGRVYFPIGEIRSVGTLLNVDIIGSARELKELIDKQIEEGITPPDVDMNFGVDPDLGNVDPGFSVNPNPGLEKPLPDGGDESVQENGDIGQNDNGETEETVKDETEQSGEDTLPLQPEAEGKETNKAKGGIK